MKLSLSEISTVNASFAEDVAAYAAAGFDGIGIWEFKLPADDAANRDLLASAGLAVANCVPAVPSILELRIPGMEGPPDPEERVEALGASVRRLSAYGPESIVVLTGPAGDLSAEDAQRVVVAGLGRLAAAACEAGVRLGLEPIRASQRQQATLVASVREAVALLDDGGLDNVGIMFDTYNVGDTATAFDDVATYADRVTGLHVADAPADASRTDRLLPGEGATPTKELVAALCAAGWDGFVDVEVFSTPEGFWGLPADEAARRAHAAATRLLEAGSEPTGRSK